MGAEPVGVIGTLHTQPVWGAQQNLGGPVEQFDFPSKEIIGPIMFKELPLNTLLYAAAPAGASEPTEPSDELKRLREEVVELDQLRDKLAGILSRTAIALRGPEPPLTRWSWHDLPELSAAAMAALEEARTGLLWYRDRFPEAVDGSDDEAMARIDAALGAGATPRRRRQEPVPTDQRCAMCSLRLAERLTPNA